MTSEVTARCPNSLLECRHIVQLMTENDTKDDPQARFEKLFIEMPEKFLLKFLFPLIFTTIQLFQDEGSPGQPGQGFGPVARSHPWRNTI